MLGPPGEWYVPKKLSYINWQEHFLALSVATSNFFRMSIIWICTFFVVIFGPKGCFGVNCESLFNSEGATPMNLAELQNLGVKELNECLSSIGSKPLDQEVAQKIWNSMKGVSQKGLLM